MRSLSIKITLDSLPAPFETFLLENNFDFEISTNDNNKNVVWIHNVDHLGDGYNFSHLKNFDKNIYNPSRYALMNVLENKKKSDTTIGLFEEDENGDVYINDKVYKPVIFSEIPGKVLALLKRIDDL